MRDKVDVVAACREARQGDSGSLRGALAGRQWRSPVRAKAAAAGHDVMVQQLLLLLATRSRQDPAVEGREQEEGDAGVDAPAGRHPAGGHRRGAMA